MNGTHETQTDSTEEYRQLLMSHYENLQEQDASRRQSVALAEVRLRLFLSLLDKPQHTDSSASRPYSGREQQCG
jgi:hypothetical protein